MTSNDLAGQRFGKLVAVDRCGTRHHHALWRCVCDCGSMVETIAARLNSGQAQSCGCSMDIGRFHRSPDTAGRYTPARYVDAARLAMGGIDLDPASCTTAQQTVRAHHFYTKGDDGLAQYWVAGTVWLNPPCKRGLVEKFVGKLVRHHLAGDVRQATLLVSSQTSTRWFQEALRAATALCLADHRIPFTDRHGHAKRSVSDSAFIYFGPYPGRFARQFQNIGPILRP